MGKESPQKILSNVKLEGKTKRKQYSKKHKSQNVVVSPTEKSQLPPNKISDDERRVNAPRVTLKTSSTNIPIKKRNKHRKTTRRKSSTKIQVIEEEREANEESVLQEIECAKNEREADPYHTCSSDLSEKEDKETRRSILSKGQGSFNSAQGEYRKVSFSRIPLSSKRDSTTPQYKERRTCWNWRICRCWRYFRYLRYLPYCRYWRGWRRFRKWRYWLMCRHRRASRTSSHITL